jgi:hypothetical protein
MIGQSSKIDLSLSSNGFFERPAGSPRGESKLTL